MPLIEWNNDLSVNIPIIDDQHKKLISYLNDLYSHMKVGKGREIIGEMLNKLIEYTKFHFKTEEDFFNKFNYPEKEEHEKEHNFFIEKISTIYNDFSNAKLSDSITSLTTATIKTFNFLYQWVSNHIMQTDKKYESFLKDKIQ